MVYQDFLAGMARYGAARQDVCQWGLGVPASDICETVILAPWWSPSAFGGLEETLLSRAPGLPIQVWGVTLSGVRMTWVKTGIGAPVLMDALLTLGVTGCRRLLFVGSVGALDGRMNIGDIVVPAHSICGDGANRYLLADPLGGDDTIGQKAYPDPSLFARLTEVTERICGERSVGWHVGHTFSIDTIFAQFAHLDAILALGCDTIEMETSAAFRAAALAGIPMAALFSVSDNTIANKSLVAGRTEEELEYRRSVIRETFPRIVAETLATAQD